MLPWVPEAFHARIPVSAVIGSWFRKPAQKLVFGLHQTRVGLRPTKRISPSHARKKPLVPIVLKCVLRVIMENKSKRILVLTHRQGVLSRKKYCFFFWFVLIIWPCTWGMSSYCIWISPGCRHWLHRLIHFSYPSKLFDRSLWFALTTELAVRQRVS